MESLFNFFYQEKIKKDSKHKIPTGSAKISHLAVFDDLLKIRSLQEVKRVISWAFSLKFWCSRLSTPAKLKQHFGDAFIEMNNANSTDNKELRANENRSFATNFLELKRYKEQSQVKIELLSKYVEIGNNIHQPICINYDEKSFKELFESALRKWKLI